MTRAEHLAWAKERALQYLPGDPPQAMVSMLSDLGKHEELRGHIASLLAPFYGSQFDPVAVRSWIEGFN